MWELMWSNAVSKCPEIVRIVDGVNSIIRDLANSWYESYHAACMAANTKMPQPSALKKLKFVKHVEIISSSKTGNTQCNIPIMINICYALQVHPSWRKMH